MQRERASGTLERILTTSAAGLICPPATGPRTRIAAAAGHACIVAFWFLAFGHGGAARCAFAIAIVNAACAGPVYCSAFARQPNFSVGLTRW